MANQLSMADIQAIRALHASGNSDRRISALLGVHRETVAKHTAGLSAPPHAPGGGSDAAASGPPEPEGAPPNQNRPNAPTGSDALPNATRRGAFGTSDASTQTLPCGSRLNRGYHRCGSASTMRGMYDRGQLIRLFHERALKFGDFTLASGKKSSYYLDGKQITLHSSGLWLVSFGLLKLLDDVDFTAIGGMSIGADPIVGGVLTAAAQSGRSIDGFLVRKEAKGHGTNRFIEGPVQPGAKVVVIDDVVTTGGSALQAVDRIVEFGCQVVCVVGIVDRKEGGAANFAARGLPFRSLLTIEDFGIAPPGAH